MLAALATAVEMHFLHGIPLGRISKQLGVDAGSLMGIFHRLARLFKDVPARLVEWYRESLVRHADETGWRQEGQNGYARLFATTELSLFQFKQTRSGEVAQAVLGGAPLPGVLIVDRYAGYNKAPCAIQYCYAHLLQEGQGLDKGFPAVAEVQTFVAPLVTDTNLHSNITNIELSVPLSRAGEPPARHTLNANWYEWLRKVDFFSVKESV